MGSEPQYAGKVNQTIKLQVSEHKFFSLVHVYVTCNGTAVILAVGVDGRPYPEEYPDFNLTPELRPV